MDPVYTADRDEVNVAASRVARNTAYLAAADFLNKLLAFLFFTLAARHLGVERFGTFSFALAVAAMLSVFADLGLGFVTARDLARSPSNAASLVGNSLAIRVVASLFLVGAATAGIGLLGYPAETRAVVSVASLFILTSSILLYLGTIFQGLERMEFTALGRTLQVVLLVAGGLLVRTGPASVLRYAWLYVGACLAATMVSAVPAASLVRGLGVRVRPRAWPALLRTALPFGVAAVFVIVYLWNGTALLSRLRGDAEVGLFSAALRLVLGVGFLAYAFSGAMYPVMSRLHSESPARLSFELTRSLRYVIALVIPIGVVGCVLSDGLVQLVYGGQYAGSAAVLRVLLWWGVFASVNSMLSNYLYAVDRPRVVMVQSMIGLAVNVVGNLLLIPILGGMGVAFSLVLAELVGTAILFFAQRTTASRLDVRCLSANALRCLPAVILTAAVALVVTRWSTVAALIGAVPVYLVLLLIFGGLSTSDLRMLRGMLARRFSGGR
jgi:O-antigen/teichoic acid export membrane protein